MSPRKKNALAPRAFASANAHGITFDASFRESPPARYRAMPAGGAVPVATGRGGGEPPQAPTSAATRRVEANRQGARNARSKREDFFRILLAALASWRFLSLGSFAVRISAHHA